MEQIKQNTLSELLSKFTLDVVDVPILEIIPNRWNPNIMDLTILDKLEKSIERFGFIDPLLVRKTTRDNASYEIIDGEHRYKIECKRGSNTVKCLVIQEEVPDEVAMALTIVSNKTKGQHDLLKEARVIESINNGQQMLLDILPMDKRAIAESIKLLGFDFDKFRDMDISELEKSKTNIAMELSVKLYNELKKLHSLLDNENFRLLIEGYFQWFNVWKEKSADN